MIDKIIIDGLSFALPLFVMAIGGIYSERSGVTNLAQRDKIAVVIRQLAHLCFISATLHRFNVVYLLGWCHSAFLCAKLAQRIGNELLVP